MQTVDILRSQSSHNSAGQRVYDRGIEETYSGVMYPQYSQLSADIDAPASGIEAGGGVVSPMTSKSVKTPKKKKNPIAAFTSSLPIIGGGGTDTTGQGEVVHSDLNKTHALIGALIGGVIGYAYKKDVAWALGGAAVGYMGTNLYETKSIFG